MKSKQGEKGDMNNSLLVAGWIAASLTGELTEEEFCLLEKWRLQSEENQQLYERIRDTERQKLKREKFASFDKFEGWNGYREKQKEYRRKLFRVRVTHYAAAMMLILSVSSYFWYEKEGEKVPVRESIPVMPGGARAQLVMADGRAVDLVKQAGIIEGKRENVLIHNTREQISYEDTTHLKADEMVYNEVRVPRCGEYQVKLSDGTLVYLNSLTRLRFPVSFTGDTREVELEGEAYFEVARDALKPFIVKTDAYDVRVLGTHFNISTYKEDAEARTTLVEGAVAISGKGIEGEIKLQPDGQFAFDRESGEIEVRSVDVSYFVAWKDGKFRFRDVRLEDIMRVVERWYDVTVIYEDEEVKDFHFGFNVSRLETIDPLLRIFELNGRLQIYRDGKELRIRRGR